VLAEPARKKIPNFPPCPNAKQAGSAVWEADRPGVGVYLQADVPTFFLGWFNGNSPITVRAFSASLVETESQWLSPYDYE
jgi:hypothetical protein